jgi:hypothetical protein
MKICEDFASNFGDKINGYCIATTHGLILLVPLGNFLLYFSVSLIEDETEKKKRHFDTIEVMEAESQAALITPTEHNFLDALKKMAEALGTVHTRGKGTSAR